MIKRISVSMFLLMMCFSAFSQIYLTDKNRHVNQSTVYLEVGGTGYYYSMNYEHLLWRNKSSLSLFGRAGLEYIPFKVAEMALHIPAGVNMVIGGKKSAFEFGADALFRINFSNAATGEGFYLTNPPTRIFFCPIVGYRYYSKPNEYGETFLLRVTFSPLIGFNVFSDQPFVKYWAGISIGKTWTSEKKWKK